MSGGHFGYTQHHLKDMAEEINNIIADNDNQSANEYREKIGHGYSAETIAKFKIGVRALEIAYVYIQRIDWLLCGDDGENSFNKRMIEDLHTLQKTGSIDDN
jgi:hypothetical protein